ncbi:hypothetical protein M426DRAFT_21983 [Hypoxylon sp. CI-4A]|nr:hypothetical protein M426DRAFT_21983 [Hypoxylon sp. CI-4A]
MTEMEAGSLENNGITPSILQTQRLKGDGIFQRKSCHVNDKTVYPGLSKEFMSGKLGNSHLALLVSQEASPNLQSICNLQKLHTEETSHPLYTNKPHQNLDLRDFKMSSIATLFDRARRRREYVRLNSEESTRVLLVGDMSIQSILERNNLDMESAFQHSVETFLSQGKLTITEIRIGTVTEDSLAISLEARHTNTGRVSAELSPISLEMHGPSGSFGRITLPAHTVTPTGAYVAVERQQVRITDKAALIFFLRAVLKGTRTPFRLRNGACTIAVPAFGVGPRPLVYEQDAELVCMNGPQARITSAKVQSAKDAKKEAAAAAAAATIAASSSSSASTTNQPTITSSRGGGPNRRHRRRHSSSSHVPVPTKPAVTLVLRLQNPSVVQISFGTCEFEIRNGVEDGDQVFAVLKGRFDVRAEYFDVSFRCCDIDDRRVSLPAERARLVGRRCGVTGWLDQVVKRVDVPLEDVWRLQEVLGLDFEKPGGSKKDRVFRWRGKFWRKDTWI